MLKFCRGSNYATIMLGGDSRSDKSRHRLVSSKRTRRSSQMTLVQRGIKGVTKGDVTAVIHELGGGGTD